MPKKNELQPWRTERYCIPEVDRPRFVAQMETVLDVYQQEYNADHVLICMDESSRQILADVSESLPAKPRRGNRRGTLQRVDDKYDRRGVRSLLVFYNPIDGWRRIGCRESRTRVDWADEVRILLTEDYPTAQTITLVCDNLNTHSMASLYHAFDANLAGELRRRLNLVFTPKNGSWLNMAEMELSILSRQCIGNRRFGNESVIDAAINTWVSDRNTRRCGSVWRFTTEDARIKLQTLYPRHDN